MPSVFLIRRERIAMNSILNSIFEELPEELDSIRKTRSYILREVDPCPSYDDPDEHADEGGSLDPIGEAEGNDSGDEALDLLGELFGEHLEALEAPFDNYCGSLFDEVEDEDDGNEAKNDRDEADTACEADAKPDSDSLFEGWDVLDKKRFEILDESGGNRRAIAHLDLVTYGLGELKVSHLAASASSMFITGAKGDIARYNLKLIAELMNEHLGKHFDDARVSHYVDFGCSLFSSVDVDRFFSADDPSSPNQHLAELAAEIVEISDFMRGLTEVADFLEIALPDDMPLKEKIRHD